MFQPEGSTVTVDSAPETECKAHDKLIQELLEYIKVIETDRQLYQERENALLDLLGLYRDEMLQRFKDFKVSSAAPEENVNLEVENASPVCYHPPDRNLPSGSLPSSDSNLYPLPQIPEGGTEEHEEDMIGHTLQGSDAIKALLALSTSSRTLTLFQTESQEAHYQTAEENLQQIPHLISNFVINAANLYKLCLESQGVLIPRTLDWYMEHATRTLARFIDETEAQVAHQHPKELTFYIHGLQKVLAGLCKDALCLGHGSDNCTHMFVPEVGDCPEDEIVSVSVVHPGRNWVDVQRYLFAGLKGVTMLDGEVFSLVTLAILKKRRSDTFFDKELWEDEYQDIYELDVFWLVPDDSIADDQPPDQYSDDTSQTGAGDTLTGMVGNSTTAGEVGGDHQSEASGEYYGNFSYPNYKPEVPAPGTAVKPDKVISQPEITTQIVGALSELEVFSQAHHPEAPCQLDDNFSEAYGEIPTAKTSIKPARKTHRSESTSQSIGVLSELELQEAQDLHPYLRAGGGVRTPSFLSPKGGDDRVKTPPPPVTPHPFLKRGHGERRRTQSNASPSPSPNRWKG